MTSDTWNSIRNALREADKNDKRVVQIPMIRLVEPQSSDILNEMTTLDNLILNPHLSDGALAEAQIAFRRDLLPHGFTPYDTRSGYGVHNKLDMLSLCGESIWWHFDVVEGGPRLALLSQFWNASVCYCSEEVRNRAQEVWDWHHKFGLLPGVHNDDWIRATSPFRKTNLPIARQCGLWTRLWPYVSLSLSLFLYLDIRILIHFIYMFSTDGQIQKVLLMQSNHLVREFNIGISIVLQVDLRRVL